MQDSQKVLSSQYITNYRQIDGEGEYDNKKIIEIEDRNFESWVSISLENEEITLYLNEVDAKNIDKVIEKALANRLGN